MSKEPKVGVIEQERARQAALTLDERIEEDFRRARVLMVKRDGVEPDRARHRELWLRVHADEAGDA